MERCGQFSVRLYSYEATSQRTCMSFHQCLDIYKLGEISSCDNPAGAGIVFVFGNTRERFDLAQLWFLLVNPTPFLYVAEKRLQLYPTPGESTPNLMSNSALVRIWRFNSGSVYSHSHKLVWFRTELVKNHGQLQDFGPRKTKSSLLNLKFIF